MHAHTHMCVQTHTHAQAVMYLQILTMHVTIIIAMHVISYAQNTVADVPNSSNANVDTIVRDLFST